MGIHDRTYWKEPPGGYRDKYSRGGGPMMGRMPKPGRAVKWLLIVNAAMFFLGMNPAVVDALSLKADCWWQVWRYVTFQFLHAGLLHILFNMIGLYFLGMILEQTWGPKRFLAFYLTCGMFAGLCHVVFMAFVSSSPIAMVIRLMGASGGVYAIVLVCAILHPQIRVFVFLFPMPIRVAALLFIGIAVYSILPEFRGRAPVDNVSHVAHLGGAVAGAFWVWVVPRLQGAAVNAKIRRSKGAWDRKMKQRTAEQAEVDRILQKVHDKGLGGLSGREKKILQDASRKQRGEDRDLYRA